MKNQTPWRVLGLAFLCVVAGAMGSGLYPDLADRSYSGVLKWSQPRIASGSTMPSIGIAEPGDLYILTATPTAPAIYRAGVATSGLAWIQLSGSGGSGPSGTLSGDVIGQDGSNTISAIQGIPIAMNTASAGAVLQINGIGLVFGQLMHSALGGLDYDSSGHTGFAPSVHAHPELAGLASDNVFVGNNTFGTGLWFDSNDVSLQTSTEAGEFYVWGGPAFDAVPSIRLAGPTGGKSWYEPERCAITLTSHSAPPAAPSAGDGAVIIRSCGTDGTPSKRVSITASGAFRLHPLAEEPVDSDVTDSAAGLPACDVATGAMFVDASGSLRFGTNNQWNTIPIASGSGFSATIIIPWNYGVSSWSMTISHGLITALSHP